jgi:Tfp pilus assembly protein PilP
MSALSKYIYVETIVLRFIVATLSANEKVKRVRVGEFLGKQFSEGK